MSFTTEQAIQKRYICSKERTVRANCIRCKKIGPSGSSCDDCEEPRVNYRVQGTKEKHYVSWWIMAAAAQPSCDEGGLNPVADFGYEKGHSIVEAVATTDDWKIMKRNENETLADAMRFVSNGAWDSINEEHQQELDRIIRSYHCPFNDPSIRTAIAGGTVMFNCNLDEDSSYHTCHTDNKEEGDEQR